MPKHLAVRLLRDLAQFPVSPCWPPTGRRIKIPLDYEYGSEKTWTQGAVCARDGQALTQTTSHATSGQLIKR
ncbi:MAG TPA: hypothetical protein VE338_11010 [Ktedonobacterales bacterium]|jgi:hypothetical protein|nr:hypothetical protein [Ktedonobacterales bacterium]